MPRKGRQLELLVSRLEETLGPMGIEVRSPERIRGRRSGVLREVDVSIRGKLGTTNVLVILECRDRAGTEDVSWVDELHGKREDVGADKAVAVSSTGFSSGARQHAANLGIELRTMEAVGVVDFFEWYGYRRLVIGETIYDNLRVRVWTEDGLAEWGPSGPPFEEIFRNPDERDQEPAQLAKRLLRKETGEEVDLQVVWSSLLKRLELPCSPDHPPRGKQLDSGLSWYGTAKRVQKARAKPEEPLIVDCGDGRVQDVSFLAISFDWWIIETQVDIQSAHRYSGPDEEGWIAHGSFLTPSFEGTAYLMRGAEAPAGRIDYVLSKRKDVL